MAGPGQARFYSSTFVQTSLASGISAGATTFNVGTPTGAPGTPFIVSVDQNTASEELMLVTNVSGPTYTVTRGVGGTAAALHNNGASVVHVMYAQDLTDASAHIGAFDAVHGLSSGSLVVGTTDVQTLTNKTLTSPTINTPTISAPTITGTATTGAITSSGLITAVDFKPTGLTGATAASRYVGATAGGAPVSGTFAVGDYAVDMTNGTFNICTAAGTPGTWEGIVNKDGTQTLSNKTLSAAVITGGLTGTGNVSITSGTVASDSGIIGPYFSNNGKTGAAQHSGWAGGTTGGAPTSGTYALNDFIVDDTGAFWICTAAGTPGTWANVTTAAFAGPGQTTNFVSGGANRTAAQVPFLYSAEASITVAAGSGWTFVSSGTTFHGCGEFHVTPADNSGSLGFLSVIAANCNITSGNLTLGGAAFTSAAAGVATSAVIKVNVSAVGW